MTIGLACYQPDIAQNLGAMIRVASCFAAQMDVIGPCGFPLSAKGLRPAAMDYAQDADLRYHVEWSQFLQDAAPHRLILLTTSAEVSIWDHAFVAGDVLLTGRESAGVPPEVRERCDLHLRIPMPGGGRSLNVAVSAGIALAEAARQSRAV
ncbi:MAG: TrmH family RNA methyltransferase [Pseudomonadota bacterium]